MMRLKRNNRGSIVLPSGETITIREQKALRSYVNTVNAKSKRLLEKLPKEVQRNYTTFGGETDFHIRKKSYSFYKEVPSANGKSTEKISRFANKKEFNTYLRSLKHLSDRQYESNRIAVAYDNYIKAVYHTFGEEQGVAIINRVINMDPRVLDYYAQTGELEHIGYIYNSPVSKNDQFNYIMQQFDKIEKKLK